MKFISTKIHGLIDYSVAVIMIACPWLLSFNESCTATYLLVASGIMILIYSMLTKYEFGIAHLVPMRLHLFIDFTDGLLLSVSPWLFGFDNLVYFPHLFFGMMSMIVSLLTKATPSAKAT